MGNEDELENIMSNFIVTACKGIWCVYDMVFGGITNTFRGITRDCW